jgi:hypothetical protein
MTLIKKKEKYFSFSLSKLLLRQNKIKNRTNRSELITQKKRKINKWIDF